MAHALVAPEKDERIDPVLIGVPADFGAQGTSQAHPGFGRRLDITHGAGMGHDQSPRICRPHADSARATPSRTRQPNRCIEVLPPYSTCTTGQHDP